MYRLMVVDLHFMIRTGDAFIRPRSVLARPESEAVFHVREC